MRDRAIAILLVFVALLLFTFQLGNTSLWDNDEAKYTQIAKEMATTGEFLTLTYDGRPWFVHPPLSFWLQAITGRAFGFSEFTARVWSAVFGAIGVGVTYLFGKSLFGPRAGTLSAIVLMTTFQYFAQSRLAVFDSILVAFMLLSLYSFSQGYTTRRTRSYLWGFAWAGLATLTKGPIGLLLPALGFGAFLMIRRQLGRLRQIPWWQGFWIYLLLGGAWYVVEAIRHGSPFVERVIGYYTFYRFLGAVEGQSGPVYYYLPVLILGAFPWTGFLVSMVAYHARRLEEDGSLLVLLWCAIVLVFYSIAGTKLPNYILPLYPLAAIGIASTWDVFLENPGEYRTTVGIGIFLNLLAALLVFIEVAAFGRWKYPVEFTRLGRSLLALATVLFFGLFLATGAFLLRRERWSFLLVPVAMVVAMAVLVTAVLPRVEAMRPIPPFARQLQAEVPAGEPAVALMAEIPSIRYYLDRPVEWISEPDRFLERICEEERSVAIVPAESYGKVRSALGGSMVVAREGPYIAFRITDSRRNWCGGD